MRGGRKGQEIGADTSATLQQKEGRKAMEKMKETAQKLFCGETIVNKRDLWFVGGLCLLAGIIYGVFAAPWTHGVMIGSNNGNGNGNGCGCCEEDACECEDRE